MSASTNSSASAGPGRGGWQVGRNGSRIACQPGWGGFGRRRIGGGCLVHGAPRSERLGSVPSVILSVPCQSQHKPGGPGREARRKLQPLPEAERSLLLPLSTSGRGSEGGLLRLRREC